MSVARGRPEETGAVKSTRTDAASDMIGISATFQIGVFRGRRTPQRTWKGLYARPTSRDPRLNHTEHACRMDCQLLEAGIVKQAVILFFRSLKPSGPAEHIQVAHRLVPIFVADPRKLRHYSFHKQQFA